jgi:molybdenum cofactor biosynthesis protein B|tara:strand:+ start:633 stop:1157 length:525 start_codon:yes stop_codon:yes gene_type:complete
MKPYQEHQKVAPHDVKISIITVSTSKYHDAQNEKEVDDQSGALIRKMVEKTGYQIVSQKLIDDNIEMIRLTLFKSIYDEGAEAVIITGGTGISPRDVTIESIHPLFDKELEGFGEIFRNISFHQIGSPAQLSRATAGVINDRIVYCIPGSPNAIEPALEIILPELPHAVSMARK